MIILLLSVVSIACIAYACIRDARGNNTSAHVSSRRIQYVTSDAYTRARWREYDPSITR